MEFTLTIPPETRSQEQIKHVFSLNFKNKNLQVIN
jgi:hypothetical protein